MAFDSRAVEQIRLIVRIVDHRRAPPVGERRGVINRFKLRMAIAMRWEDIVVIVRIELNEQADLSEIV